MPSRPPEINVSAAVLHEYPAVRQLLERTLHAAHELDEDVPVEDICVDVKIGRRRGHWAGHAYPEVRSYSRGYDNYLWRGIGHRRSHPRGRITMTFGRDCDERAIVRLFAHELRHLAQYWRGYQQTYRLQIVGMTSRQYERDCRQFEGRVLTRLGMDANDELAYRNHGRQHPPGATSRRALAPAATSAR